MWRLAYRPITNGIVWSTGPHRAFHINSAGTVLTIGDREFPLAAPRRTIVVEEDGRITLPDWNLRYNRRSAWFESDADELGSASTVGSGDKSGSGRRSGSAREFSRGRGHGRRRAKRD